MNDERNCTLQEPNETTYAAIEAAERGELCDPFESVEALMAALDE